LRVAFHHPGRMDGFTWEWRCDPWGWGWTDGGWPLAMRQGREVVEGRGWDR